VTKQASSFSRRDAIIDLAARSVIHGAGADNAAGRVEILVNRLLRDGRVVPVLAPAARTTSEILRVRDAAGRIIRTVDQSERRYTTIDLLAAETELLQRATSRQHASTPASRASPAGSSTRPSPPALASTQISRPSSAPSPRPAPASTWWSARPAPASQPRSAPTAKPSTPPASPSSPSAATAAHQLAMSAGITDTATVDRLLTELRYGHRALPRGVVVVLDEAAMCPTRTRLALQRAVDAVNGKIIDVGDHRQIPSVDVGGGHYALAQRLGATVLEHNHRFRDPVYRDAAELVRAQQPAAAVEVLRAQGAVSDHHAKPVDAWAGMIDDWLTHRDTGHSVLMLATERATVAELNRLARGHLVARGDITRRSRTYRAAGDHRTVTLAVGDEVILRRNHRLTQPDGTTVAVRNGMTGRVTATHRRHATIGLDAAHHAPGGPTSVTLRTSYLGEHVDHGYARTVDTAQGATVDHSLFAPSPPATAERAYVALSRGRLTNRVYTTHDRTWIDAIGRRRGHALAVDQQPAVDRSPTRHATTHARSRSRPSTATRGRPVDRRRARRARRDDLRKS
jgi:hypothetical protein